MHRTSLIVSTSACLIAGAALALAAPQDPQRPNQPSYTPPAGQSAKDSHMNHDVDNAALRACVELCGKCAASCERTATHCLTMGGEHVAPAHQNVLRDCATICATAACFMSRGSADHARVCEVCAEICEKCAEECERLGKNDQMMMECAKVCRDCAASCRKMASAG